MDIRVQKGPKQDGDSYYMVTRMPVAWWWLPVQEHPGDMEVTRAWQVMGAIHDYIATHKDANGDVPIKDDKTGETIPLEFVEMHQPMRHMKKDGEYFACTDFRKPGSQDEYYDIDFWVNQKTGKLEVDNVKVHKVPVQEAASGRKCPAIPSKAWISTSPTRRKRPVEADRRRLPQGTPFFVPATTIGSGLREEPARAASRRASVSRVETSARPSMRAGRKWR